MNQYKVVFHEVLQYLDVVIMFMISFNEFGWFVGYLVAKHTQKFRLVFQENHLENFMPLKLAWF